VLASLRWRRHGCETIRSRDDRWFPDMALRRFHLLRRHEHVESHEDHGL